MIILLKNCQQEATGKMSTAAYSQKGYQGGQTAAYDYMNKLIKRFQIDIAVYKKFYSRSNPEEKRT